MNRKQRREEWRRRREAALKPVAFPKRLSGMLACPCQGENPNCYRCGGRGYLKSPTDTELPPAVPLILPRLKKRNSNRDKKKNIGIKHKTGFLNTRQKEIQIETGGCPYCSRKVTNVDHHVSREHFIEWKEYLNRIFPRNPLEIKPGFILKRCDRCGTFAKDIKRHFTKAHRGICLTLSKDDSPIDSGDSSGGNS